MPGRLITLFVVPLICATAQSALERGVYEYAHGQYSSAVGSLTEATRLDPHNDLAHYHLGNALLRVGNKDDAIKEYQRAYSMSCSMEMSNNCKRVLDLYHASIPAVLTKNSRSTRAVSELSPYQVGSVEWLNELAKRKNNGKSLESHPGGPDVLKESPENDGFMKEEWDRWIQNFRLRFNFDLFTELRRSAIKKPSGQSLVVFSVDSSGNLKCRVIKSNANFNFNECLLTTTRRMDKTHYLKFPRDSKIKGFNFTMGWDYGPTRPLTREEVIAEIQRTNGSILRTPQGRAAVAARLANNDASGKLISTQASGSLVSANTSGRLAGKSGNLQLPSFSTSVSGLVIPHAKPVELKATPDALPEVSTGHQK